MSKYTIDDIIDVLVTTFEFRRDEVYEQIDDLIGKQPYFVEWDQGDDPTGAGTEVIDSTAIGVIEYFLRKKNKSITKEYIKTSLNLAHATSFAGMSQDDIKKAIDDLNTLFDFGIIYNNPQAVLDAIEAAYNYEEGILNSVTELPSEYRRVLDRLVELKGINGDSEAENYQERLYRWAVAALPELPAILDRYQSYKYAQIQANISEYGNDPYKVFTDSFMSAFSNRPLTMASNFQYYTPKILEEAFNQEFQRPNTEPQAVQPWEMRIGGSKFFVPPIDVKVSQFFKSGSLSGGAIRQPTSPKFNSGHSETAIQITLYFPGLESIWGIITSEDNPSVTLDFDDIDQASDEKVDYFISSLRGLIAQFKYAPFLPVRNQYLNQAWNITGVTLNSMSVSTVENFPFCVSVTLNMMKFNHKVFLPMIEDFNQSIHWGRFRQYVGRAAKAINDAYNVGFLTENSGKGAKGETVTGDPRPTWQIEQAYDQPFTRPTKKTWAEDTTRIKFYYPARSSTEIFAPDDSMFRQPKEDANIGSDDYERDKSLWEKFMGSIGVDVDQYPEVIYDTVTEYSRKPTSYINEWTLIFEYMKYTSTTVEEMNIEKLNDYLEKRIEKLKKDQHVRNPEAEIIYRNTIKQYWFGAMFSGFTDTPFYRKYLENYQYKNGSFVLKEWEVPMEELAFDEKSIYVQGISVSLSNNFAKHQIQMHDEPTYQHIGGGDNRLDISMIVFGENNLIRIRRMFERIGGLARLEHAHGVLGFLGIKNELTALAGIKYVMPLTYEVDTVPGFPRVYNVRLSFIDFDVFQQKRERLSSEQQNELVDLFGKRNPFLRIKQAWGRFNAYPDFPLSIKNKEDGKVIGTIDPDFYFRAFTTIDDDLTYWGSQPAEGNNLNLKVAPDGTIIQDDENDPNSKTNEDVNISPFGFDIKSESYDNKNQPSSYPLKVTTHLGLTSKDQDETSVIEISNGGSIRTGTQKIGEKEPKFNGDGQTGGKWTEDTAVSSNIQSEIAGLTPGARYQNCYAYNSLDPAGQFELIMNDTKYRDINGRMVKAFPTYMLWLIDEGGRFGGVKLFDNFYGLQSVVDFSINRSEDVLGDTLVLRVSNLYSKLSTPFKGFVKREDGTENIVLDDDNGNVIESVSEIPEYLIQTYENIQSGTRDDYVVELESIRLKPGVRVHLRMGYGANPNSLDTVFNGVITQVQAGDIVEIVAQSDAIELSQYINTTNKKGHSGKIDGSIGTGFYLSEPRDLMVRLLSMGSSRFKEAFAHATRGQVFSESRFGIRHFGSILYEPLNELERQRHALRASAVQNKLQTVAGTSSITKVLSPVSDVSESDIQDAAAGQDKTYSDMIGGGFSGFLGGAGVRLPLVGLMQSMWTNFFTKRDFEIFKRNIYPGNGTGVAQYLGGDVLDAGPVLLEAAGVKGPDLYNYMTNNPENNIFANTAQGKPKSQQTATDLWSETLINQALAGRRTSDTESPANTSQPNPDAPVNQAQDTSDGGIDFPSGVERLLNATPMGAGVPMAGTVLETGLNIANGIFRSKGPMADNPILRAMGLVQGGESDDDLSGFDEVSFRAQTYMRTVWDMFRLCAALLPNYIVAVRPFEDRSTVFYGKPHWLYTSGVIPLSTGVPKTDTKLKFEGPDEDFQNLLREATNRANPLADYEDQQKFMQQINTANPFTTTAGLDNNASKFSSADTVKNLPGEQGNAKLPHRSGKAKLGKHISGGSVRALRSRDELIDFVINRAQGEIDQTPILPERNPLGDTAIIDDGVDYEANRKSNARRRELVELVNIFENDHIGKNQTKINEYINNPSYISDNDKYKTIRTDEQHYEIDELPDQYKFNNWNEYIDLYSDLQDSSQEQWYVKMRWPYANWSQILGKNWENSETVIPGFDRMENYIGKRVAVANPANNKVVICSIISDGPDDIAYKAELSPDVYFSLELDKAQDSECIFGFVEPQTRLGPTTGKYSYGTNQSNTGEAVPVPVASSPDNTPEIPSGRDYEAFVQPFQGTERMVEQIYPGQYKSFNDRYDKFKELYENNYFKTSFLYGWMQGDRPGDSDDDYKKGGPRQSGFYNSLGREPDAGDWQDAKFVENYISGVSLQLRGDRVTEKAGAYDIVGEIARRIYDREYNERRAEVVLDPSNIEYYKGLYQGSEDKVREAAEATKEHFIQIRKSSFADTFDGITESEAESVWDQFRARWHIRNDGEFTEIRDAALDFIYERLRILPTMSDTELASMLGSEWLDGDSSDIDYNKDDKSAMANRILFSTNMTKIVNNFKMLLWRLPFARAWLAITTSRTTSSTVANIAGVTAGVATAVATENPWLGAGAGYVVQQSVQKLGRGEFDFANSEVSKLWRWYLGVNSDGAATNPDAFAPGGWQKLIEAAALKNEDALINLDAPMQVDSGTFSAIFKHSGLVSKFVEGLALYKTPGKKGASDLDQQLENLRNIWDQTIGAFLSLVSDALTGVVGMFRLSLMEMGYGMGMLGAMQQQANILNRAFNDSIYYGIGEPGSAIWLADNPFTREYGEPVIEIREPFQRFHYLNSFQDIIDNGIQEKLDNVPTVITASSDGKYPVTVYFDKGASPEKQFEIGVETGLFWDNARGSGFFGFLHPLLHPIETLRGINKSATGSSDEILSRRVGLSYLKEGLKDIYGGELVIVGRADIRPHDLVYLADTYERMYGIFEVEAVTHHLTSDTGFVTSITPNAVVTINDPARWTFQSWVWGMFGVQETRNHVRHLMSVTADKSARAYNTVLGFVRENGEVDMSALAESIQDSIRGSVQFTGGNSALMKDIATHAATGYLRPANSKFSPTPDRGEQAMQAADQIFNNPLTSAISTIPIIGSGLIDIAWSGWTWVRDNLLDQHGCYIQYLTKNGQPMDAGLSFNQGVAVGHHHTVNLLPGILNLDVDTTQNGHRRITANDLMSQLGWREIEVASVQRQVSWWNNYWNAKVLELAGRGPDPVAISPPNAYLAEIVPTVDGYGKYENIIDGDTIKVKKLDASGNATGELVTIRLAGINTPELPQKEDVMANDPYDKGFLARQYLENRLVTEQLVKGFKPIVAIRESVGSGSTIGSSVDSYGRTLAVVFHNVVGTVATSEERSKKLLENATAWPLISWDTFTPEGLPYTINWEMVTTGFAYTDMGGVRKNDPDRGYASGRYSRGN